MLADENSLEEVDLIDNNDSEEDDDELEGDDKDLSSEDLFKEGDELPNVENNDEESEEESNEFTLRVSNSVWPSHDFQIETKYLSTLEDSYKALVLSADYSNPQQALTTINEYVSNQTHDKVKNILSSDDIDENTKLVLINTIYLKGDWVHQFKSNKTQPSNFTTINGPKTRHFMNQSNMSINYLKVGDDIYFELPYQGGSTSMIVYLPGQVTTDFSLGQSVILDKFTIFKDADEILSKLLKVNLSMPKFKFRTRHSLDGFLREKMHLGNLYVPNMGYFKGISESANDIAVTKVIQEAVIEVDEKGTEAAAATAAMIGLTSIGPGYEEEQMHIRVDRPFGFWIVDQETGTVLYSGKVADPNEEAG